MQHRNPLLALPLALVALGACRSGDSHAEEHHALPMAAEKLEPYQCGSVTRLHTVDGVFLASQPAAEDFEQAAKGGIRTVLNLRHDSEMSAFDPAQVVAAHGMTYLHLPWNGPDELTDEVFDDSRELLRTAERPLLVYCASANRVGAVWLPYRVLDDGVAVEAALAEAKTIGMRSRDYEARALDYIERHR